MREGGVTIVGARRREEVLVHGYYHTKGEPCAWRETNGL